MYFDTSKMNFNSAITMKKKLFSIIFQLADIISWVFGWHYFLVYCTQSEHTLKLFLPLIGACRYHCVMRDKEHHELHSQSANLHFGWLYFRSSSGCLVARRHPVSVQICSERLSLCSKFIFFNEDKKLFSVIF